MHYLKCHVTVFPFGFLVEGRSYTIEFFTDLNENGLYDAPPLDYSWSLDFIAKGSAMVEEFEHDVNFTTLNSPWPPTVFVTIIAYQTEPYIGKVLNYTIRDILQNRVLVDTNLTITGKDTLTVQNITVGRDYNIDVYSDQNLNDSLDAPPTDHSWRIPFKGDVDTWLYTFVADSSKAVNIKP